MPRINTIPLDPSPQLTDKLLGTAADDGAATRNFLISDILGLQSPALNLLYWRETQDDGTAASTLHTNQWIAFDNTETNVNVAITALGTGATLAQIPDGTTTGGNARGEYATDWQKSRVSQNRVASGNYSTISGGNSNLASGIYSTVSGGNNNQSSNNRATISGGEDNIASNVYTTIGGGRDNTASGNYSTIGGGDSNTVNNAYATVSGGAGNDSTNTHSTVGGGEDNVSSGVYATVAGGTTNTASGQSSFVVGQQSRAENLGAVATGYGAVAKLRGERAHASGFFGTSGDAQISDFVLRNSSSSTSDVNLFLDGASLEISLDAEMAMEFKVYFVSSLLDGSAASSTEITGLIRRGATGGAVLVGNHEDSNKRFDDFSGNTSYAVSASGNNLRLTVTPANSSNTEHVAHVHATIYRG